MSLFKIGNVFFHQNFQFTIGTLVSRKHRCDRCRIFSPFRQINLIFYLTLLDRKSVV